MPPRYTLSTLLKTIVWFALFFAIWTHKTFLEAAGIWACVFVIYLSVRLKLQGTLWWIKPLLALIAIPCLWFLAVDRSTFVEDCPDCGWERDIVQIRIIGVPISQRTREYPTFKTEIAEWLGVTCRHADLVRTHLTRRWGLVWCCCPCFRGIWGLAASKEDPVYEKAIWQTLNEYLEQNPDFAVEFQTKVLKDHDDAFWLKFTKQIIDAVDDRLGIVPADDE